MPGGFSSGSEAERAVDQAVTFLERKVHIARGVLYRDQRIDPTAVLEYLKSVMTYEIINDDLPVHEAEELAEEAEGLIYTLAAQGIAAGVTGDSSVAMHNEHSIGRKPRSRLE